MVYFLITGRSVSLLTISYHILHVVATPRNREEPKLSAKWCENLETHARRIYAISDNIDKNTAVMILAEMIKAKEVPNPFKVSHIYKNHRTLLKTRKDVEAACEVLIEAGWLRKQEPVKGNGRPPLCTFVINPVFL